MFLTFIDRISKRSHGVEVVRFGDLRIGSRLFAIDDCWLYQSETSSSRWIGLLECEASRMKISTSKSKAMVLSQKKEGQGGDPTSSKVVQVPQGLVHN